jgi:hypothetical protein
MNDGDAANDSDERQQSYADKQVEHMTPHVSSHPQQATAVLIGSKSGNWNSGSTGTTFELHALQAEGDWRLQNVVPTSFNIRVDKSLIDRRSLWAKGELMGRWCQGGRTEVART